MSERGTYTLRVLTECGLCPGFRHFGDPEEGHRAFIEHRNTEHPAAVDRGQRARQKAASQMNWPRGAK